MKDPVVAQQRNKVHTSLLKFQKDIQYQAGSADYIVTFRKAGDNNSLLGTEKILDLEYYIGEGSAPETNRKATRTTKRRLMHVVGIPIEVWQPGMQVLYDRY